MALNLGGKVVETVPIDNSKIKVIQIMSMKEIKIYPHGLVTTKELWSKVQGQKYADFKKKKPNKKLKIKIEEEETEEI